jgi:hypothetical protein
VLTEDTAAARTYARGRGDDREAGENRAASDAHLRLNGD